MLRCTVASASRRLSRRSTVLPQCRIDARHHLLCHQHHRALGELAVDGTDELGRSILNLIVHALPWQDEVARALQKPH